MCVMSSLEAATCVPISKLCGNFFPLEVHWHISGTSLDRFVARFSVTKAEEVLKIR